MIITNGTGITTLKNGAAVKQNLNPANSTVNKGVYDATLLETVDADLAVGNILQPVQIFGKVGTVVAGVDVSDADALITDVKDPKTFYSVAAPRKTGTMPTVAITDANDNYPAGYHAGNVGGLDAIDLDLASANIKSGVTIFGKAGAATVQDIADGDLAVAEAKTGKKFYAVTGGVKTGTGTKTLDPANETVAAGYYAATTLSAVDADLVAANIKLGVNIFGKVGTLPYAIFGWWVGEQLLNSNDTEKSTGVVATPTKVKEIKVNEAFQGTIRIRFDLKSSAEFNTATGKIYRNGTPLGTVRYSPEIYQTFSQDFDINWSANDLIQIYAFVDSEGILAYVRNFRFYYGGVLTGRAISSTNQDP